MKRPPVSGCEPVVRMKRPPAIVAGAVLAGAAALAGCGSTAQRSVSSSATPPVRLVASLRLRSPGFTPRGAIPREYTCGGRDVSPPLRFSGVPTGTRELVLVMRDPDAPGGDFVHWAVAGIPPSAGGFGVGSVPAGSVQGRNSFGTIGYRGPCPPSGARPHEYVLTLSALRGRSELGRGFTADQLRTAAVALATLVGTYARG